MDTAKNEVSIENMKLKATIIIVALVSLLSVSWDAEAAERTLGFRFEFQGRYMTACPNSPGYISAGEGACDFVRVIVADQTDTNREGAIRLQDHAWQAGWFICRAELNWQNSYNFQDATFNGTLQTDSVQDPGSHQLAYLDAQGTLQGGALNGQNLMRFSLTLRTRDDPQGLSGCMIPGPVWVCGKTTEAGDRNCVAKQPGAIWK